MMDIPYVSQNPDEKILWAFGDLIKRNPENLKEELGTLVSSGCTEAMVYLGAILIDGDGSDRSKALDLFMRAADAGDSMGMRNLGYCYALGLGSKKDKVKAAEWYKKAALAGNTKAQCNLGVMYEHGNGVEKDQREAVRWFKKSSENGYSRGQTNYGIHLLEGIGVEKDPAEAARQFDLARTPRANYWLAKMYLAGVGVEADLPVAIALLEISSSNGYAKAMTLLASIIENDYPERAYDLYELAASKGNEDAKKKLNSMQNYRLKMEYKTS